MLLFYCGKVPKEDIKELGVCMRAQTWALPFISEPEGFWGFFVHHVAKSPLNLHRSWWWVESLLHCKWDPGVLLWTLSIFPLYKSLYLCWTRWFQCKLWGWVKEDINEILKIILRRKRTNCGMWFYTLWRRPCICCLL